MKGPPSGAELGAPLSSPDGVASTRDTDATSFTTILEQLIASVPGALAAAIVDPLGETVDYAGQGDPFDLRVAAAHLQIVVNAITSFGALGEPRWLVVRGARKSAAVTVLADGYWLVLLLRPRAAFSLSTRAIKACTRALAAEAGWPVPEGDERSWFPLEVETDRRGRPLRIGASKVAVEILGAVMGLSVKERGFRVRTSEGTELTLVREGSTRWYADEPA